MTMEQFDNMTIKDLHKLTKDHKRISEELEYLKTKYPKAREYMGELSAEKLVEGLK